MVPAADPAPLAADHVEPAAARPGRLVGLLLREPVHRERDEDEERAPGEGDGRVGKSEHAVERERLLVRGDHLGIQERVLDESIEEHSGEEPGDGRRAHELLGPSPPPALATQVPGQRPETPSPMPKRAPPSRWAAPR